MSVTQSSWCWVFQSLEIQMTLVQNSPSHASIEFQDLPWVFADTCRAYVPTVTSGLLCPWMAPLFCTTQTQWQTQLFPRFSQRKEHRHSLSGGIPKGSSLLWRVRDLKEVEKQCKAPQMEHWTSSSLEMPMAGSISTVHFSNSSLLPALLIPLLSLSLWETKTKTKHKYLLLPPA